MLRCLEVPIPGEAGNNLQYILGFAEGHFAKITAAMDGESSVKTGCLLSRNGLPKTVDLEAGLHVV